MERKQFVSGNLQDDNRRKGKRCPRRVQMIFVTGDTHKGFDAEKLNIENFPEQKGLTKDDYVIICGDFGYCPVRDKDILDEIALLNYTTLFIDGNHEEFETLYKTPLVDFCGGKAHKVNNSIFHLIRGEVYNLQGLKTWVMGGGIGSDTQFDLYDETLTLFSEDIPHIEEMKHGLEALEVNNFHVDLVLTHDAPLQMKRDLKIPDLALNLKWSHYLQDVYDRLSYKKWFCGHLHRDFTWEKPDEKDITCLLDKVVKVL